ncbi:anti-sigma factor [Pedobacter ginsengisoli]|uniref:Anti-sigma factor n=1 Tax=Pedobacter ginsengisoli TaxID=363852 RepID=A0A2D1U6F4_9SPHI|nr:FecR family protein [Pedobacter ginsengisoli]ATP57191.1 anti-sigma factor [Pedobacter ginsengisoli]
MKEQDAKDLLKKYVAGNCTEEEKGLLETWYLQYEIKDLPQIAEEDKEEQLDEVFRSLPIHRSPIRVVSLWPRIAAAAMVLIILGSGLYFYRHKLPKEELVRHEHVNDIKPGGNKAILTLADGRNITLDDAANGSIAKQAGVTISKTKDGQLVYEVIASANDDVDAPYSLNTITTPKGGQYQISLPDGSKVWLNAASSLSYPLRFNKKERKVELTGEAYFEVAHNTALPFKVKTANQQVEVLGTHFNVNAYQDEKSAKTTLLEGSVKISQIQSNVSKLLKPGQQAIVTNAISVIDVDTEEAIAWKDNLLMFNEDNLDHIMRMIARWYNVEIVFNDDSLKTELYSGSVSKFANVSHVLKKLEQLGGVRFTIDDRTIKISRN